MNGILMIPSNLKATRELRKTMTRRLDHLKEINKTPDAWTLAQGIIASDGSRKFHHKAFAGNYDGESSWVKPHYRVGETIYIKELHYLYGVWAYEGLPNTDIPLNRRKWRFVRGNTDIRYPENRPNFARHTWRDGRGWYKRTPMFMSEKDARTFIKITEVKIEHLQDITIEDIKAEGIEEGLTDIGYYYAFGQLWNSINGKTYPWGLNPYVWVYTYKLVDRSKQ